MEVKIHKREIVYAFIDSQNLYLGVKSQGWTLDWRKFRQYLRNKYNVTKAFLFIGYLPGNEALYTNMQQKGFIVRVDQLKGSFELKKTGIGGRSKP